MASTPNWRDIEHAELFDGLPPDDLKLILSRSSRQEVPKGFFLYHQGEPAKTMFLLEAGRVRLKETTEDGREVLIRLIYPGEVFGAVIADALYRATIERRRRQTNLFEHTHGRQKHLRNCWIVFPGFRKTYLH